MIFKLIESFEKPDIFDPEKSKSEVTASKEQIEKEEVVEMTGRDYLRFVKDISNKTFDQLSSQIKTSYRFKKLVDLMRDKNKIAAPILYYINDKPVRYDGKHRLFAFAEIAGWYTKFPVLKVILKE